MSKTFDAKKYHHDRYFRLKSEHKCVCCGEPLAESINNLRCEFCQEKRKATRRKQYEKKRREKLLCALAQMKNGGGE